MIKYFRQNPSQVHIDDAIKTAKSVPSSVVSFVYENAKVQSKGVLSGVPIVLKDNYTTCDAPTSAGSNFLKNFYPHYDAEVTTRLKKAGASIVVKSSLDEFAMGGTGLYGAKGEIPNPLNEKYLVGGSSSGSAYLLAKNNAFGAALSSDTGDSSRKPASYVGKVGFKPTYGIVSRYGLIAFATSLDTAAWMTHNVEDAAAVANVLIGKDKKDFSCISSDFVLSKVQKQQPIKIGLFINEKHFDAQMIIKMKLLQERLLKDNVKVELININPDFIAALLPTYQIISFAEATSNLSNLTGVTFGNRQEGATYRDAVINSRSAGFSYMAQRRITTGSYFLEKEHQSDLFLRAQKVRRVLADYWADLLKKYQFIAYPSQSHKTPTIVHAKKIAEKRKNPYDDIMLFDNFLGAPAISLPFSNIDNMPYGLSVSASVQKDAELLSVSLYLEDLIKELNE